MTPTPAAKRTETLGQRLADKFYHRGSLPQEKAKLFLVSLLDRELAPLIDLLKEIGARPCHRMCELKDEGEGPDRWLCEPCRARAILSQAVQA